MDSGDLLFKKYRSPVSENEWKGTKEKAQLIIDCFNIMGYDAVGIGDDDLSLGKEFLLEVSKKARFPFLSSNLFDEATGRTLFQSFLIKETKGLRIGIFSLLSPDLFTNPSDPRKKGLNFRPPIETAQSFVKELKPKTDLIILLSHLGYSKDVELAQMVQGIQIIVGSHTGMNLTTPPIIQNTILLQIAPQGKFGGRIGLLFYNNSPSFYNSATKSSLENNLNMINLRLNSTEIPENEKARWRKSKDEIEQNLNKLKDKNEFKNTILSLHDRMREDPEIRKRIENYKIRAQAGGNPESAQ